MNKLLTRIVEFAILDVVDGWQWSKLEKMLPPISTFRQHLGGVPPWAQNLQGEHQKIAPQRDATAMPCGRVKLDLPAKPSSAKRQSRRLATATPYRQRSWHVLVLPGQLWTSSRPGLRRVESPRGEVPLRGLLKFICRKPYFRILDQYTQAVIFSLLFPHPKPFSIPEKHFGSRPPH